MTEIEVAGALGPVESPEGLLDSLKEMNQGSILPLNPDLVCDRDHLLSAAMHAERAFRTGTNSASTLTMETLLYASGERQISKATAKMGVRPHSERIALVTFDVPVDEVISALGMRRDDSVLDCSPEKLREFGIADEEMSTLPEGKARDLVLERVAFVDLIKR